MGRGEFEQPERGPQTGPTPKVNVGWDDLQESQKAELGKLNEILQKDKEADQLIPGIPVAQDEAQGTPTLEETSERIEALWRVLAAQDEGDVQVEDDDYARTLKAAEPTEEDKQGFIRSVLGNIPYEKTFKLFGEAVEVVASDLSPTEEEAIYRQLEKDQDDGMVTTEDEWELAMLRYRVVKCLKVGGKQLGEGDLLRDRVTAWLHETRSATYYRSIMQVIRIFGQHLEFMYQRAIDSDFWKAGGSDSQSELT